MLSFSSRARQSVLYRALFIALLVTISLLSGCSSEEPSTAKKPAVVEDEAATETAPQAKAISIEQTTSSDVQQETKSPETEQSVTTEETVVESVPKAIVNREIVFTEGTDYVTKFPNEQPQKPILVEFFSYMCPHCYNFEGTVNRWKKQKPDSVTLLKIPVSFGRGRWSLAAKSYYIAEELDITEQFNPAMFRKIHIEKKPPLKEADLEKLFASLGVSSKQFKAAASSFNVDSKMRKADFLAKKYQVSGVPYFLINYKYEIGKASYESEASLFKLWNNLPSKDF